MEILAIATVEKFVIAAVYSREAHCVLDRAPILFRASGDLLHAGDQSLEVPAVFAVELFDSVEFIISSIILFRLSMVECPIPNVPAQRGRPAIDLRTTRQLPSESNRNDLILSQLA